MRNEFDVAVVGLGIMGSAIVAELARQGAHVIGLDAYGPGHDRGASTGQSRIFRRSHPDYPAYATDTEPALQAWQSLQAAVGVELFLPTSALRVGPSGSPYLAAAAAASDKAAAPYELLSADMLRRRYSQLRFSTSDEGFLDIEAGVLLAEPCLAAYQEVAVRHGAELKFSAPVPLDRLVGDWVERGSLPVAPAVRAQYLVLAVGAWLDSAPAELRWPDVSVERTVSHWFSAGYRAAALSAPGFPIVEWGHGDSEFCLIPAIDGLVKAKRHHTGDPADPVVGATPPKPEEAEAARLRLEQATGLAFRFVRARADMYTNVANGALQVSRSPHVPRMSVVTACSGHGFKFAPLIAARTAEQAWSK